MWVGLKSHDMYDYRGWENSHGLPLARKRLSDEVIMSWNCFVKSDRLQNISFEGIDFIKAS